MNKKKNPRLLQFNVRVTPEELSRLKTDADIRDMSLSSYVRTILKFAMFTPPTIENSLK